MKTSVKQICMGRDFSTTPMGRDDPEDGDFTGQRFREKFLLPALKDHETVEVKIDDTEGYASSFLEEAFGGLVRKHGFTKEELNERLKIIQNEPGFGMYERAIWDHINSAIPEEKPTN